MSTTPKFRHIVYLAYKDLVHEWLLTACFIIALCAVITPVLILLGLKTGVLQTWKERILTSPSALEISFREHTNLPDKWFTDMRKYPETGFVIPSLFSASATMTIKSKNNTSFIRGVDIIPTAKGDPLSGKGAIAPKTAHEITLTKEATKNLGVALNDTITAVISRTYKGQRQHINHPMKVIYIVPDTVFSREAAFVSVSFITALESYKDGRQVSIFKELQGRTAEPIFPPYPRARLYASNLENVIPLSALASRQGDGVKVTPRKAEVFRLQHAHKMISGIFNLIATMAFSGILLSLSASLWANIDRKHQQLALLQLMGLQKIHMIVFPIIQACCISIISLLLSLVFYTLNAQWIDTIFAEYMQENEVVTRLFVTDFTFLSLILILVASFAALLGGYRATKIEPAEAMRGL